MLWNCSLLSSIPPSIHYALLSSFSCRIPYLALGGFFVYKEYAGSDSREISRTRYETIPYHLQLSGVHLFGNEVEWRTQLQFAVTRATGHNYPESIEDFEKTTCGHSSL